MSQPFKQKKKKKERKKSGAQTEKGEKPLGETFGPRSSELLS